MTSGDVASSPSRMSRIQRIVRKALSLAHALPKATSSGFDGELLDQMHELSAADLGFNSERCLAYGRGRAPCVHQAIFENDVASMSIFGMRGAGVEIPLHDHPQIHGAIKVIHGRIRVESFTLLRDRDVLRARFDGDTTIGVADRPAVLTPTERGIHRVSAVGGPAAFFDVLMPPYDPPRGRDCQYYREREQRDGVGSTVELERIPAPHEYWCESARYEGPPPMS